MCGCGKISRKMARKSNSKFSKALMQGGVATLSAYGSDFLDPIIGGNQMLAGGIKAAVGLFGMTQKDDFIQAAGTGMMVAGGKQLIESLIPSSVGYIPRGNFGNFARTSPDLVNQSPRAPRL